MESNVIGNKIRRLRKEKEMTQRKLANALNVVHSTVSNWEHGKRQPSVMELKRIADYFGVSLSYFEVLTQAMGTVLDDESIDALFQTINQQPLGTNVTKIMQAVFLIALAAIFIGQLSSGVTSVIFWLAAVFGFTLVVFHYIKQYIKTQSKHHNIILVSIDKHIHYIHHKERASVVALRQKLIIISALLVFSTAGYYLWLTITLGALGRIFLTILSIIYTTAGILAATTRFKAFSGHATLKKKILYQSTFKHFYHHTVFIVFLLDAIALMGFTLLVMIEYAYSKTTVTIWMLFALGVIHTLISGWICKRYNHFINGYRLYVSDDEGATKQLPFASSQ